MSSLKISDLSPDQKPYERCERFGPESLSDTELLAVILRTGSKNLDVITLAERLLSGEYASDGISMILHIKYEELLSIKGVGRVKALQLMCIAEIVKRIWRKELGNSISFNDSSSCAMYYKQDMRYLEREVFKLVFLDVRNRLISDFDMTVGTINSSLVSIREVLIEALRRRAVNIILVHNHPGGEAEPSEADIEVTQKVKEGCHCIGIGLYDHIIIGDNRYYSFKEHSIL